jgi:hypothetical protein
MVQTTHHKLSFQVCAVLQFFTLSNSNIIVCHESVHFFDFSILRNRTGKPNIFYLEPSMGEQWNWAALCKGGVAAKEETFDFNISTRSVQNQSHNPLVSDRSKQPKPSSKYHAGAKKLQTDQANHAYIQEHIRLNKFGFVPVAVRSRSTQKQHDDESMESFSNLRVKDREISVDDMRANMDGRTNIHLADLEKEQLRKMEKSDMDWVTIGVVTHRKVMEHIKCVVWTISDLKKTLVSLFLYNEAYDAHWQVHNKSIYIYIYIYCIPYEYLLVSTNP